MQKARGQRRPARRQIPSSHRSVGTRFQGLFHPPPGVLFTVPSRYWSTIGHRLVSSLGRWSCLLRSGFLVSRPTPDLGPSAVSLPPTGLSPSLARPSSRVRLHHTTNRVAGRPPRTGPLPRVGNGCRLPAPTRFGLVPVRSPLLGESLTWSLFLRVLRCFSSPGWLPPDYRFIQEVTGHHPGRVAPFGHPRIHACVRLPTASRS